MPKRISYSVCHIKCVAVYILIEQNRKRYNQCILRCNKIDFAKLIHICEHQIKFGEASSTRTAMPLLMKQIAMYIIFETDLYIA